MGISTIIVCGLGRPSLLGDGVVLLLDLLDWHTVFIVSSSSGRHSETATTIASMAVTSDQLTVAHWSSVDEDASDEDIKDTLKLISEQARSP